MVARAWALAGTIALAACSANDDIRAPTISAVMPGRGAPGTFVTVTGSDLCQQPHTGGDDDPLACAHVGTLLFDTVPAVATAYGDTMVMAEVPQLATGEVSVSVSVAGRSSNRLSFVVE
jgi:uncharacterized protein (TIGR03437 family)